MRCLQNGEEQGAAFLLAGAAINRADHHFDWSRLAIGRLLSGNHEGKWRLSVKNLHDTMKQLQKASESLSRLSLDQDHPWKALGQMHQILNSNFWENLVVLSNHAAPQAKEKSSEIVPTIKKSKKKAKGRPAANKVENSGLFPSTDIFKTESMLIVCCELPGFVRDSLEVTLTDQRVLELSGKVKEHDQTQSLVYSERTYGTFYRRFELPATVSSKGMRAEYQDGLLELYLVRDSHSREQKTTFKANL